MQKPLDWTKANIETAIALTLASVVSVLGLVDAAPSEMIENAVLLTLAVFAFALLRERWRRDNAENQIADLAQEANSKLDELKQLIGDIATVKTTIATVETTINQVNKMVSDLSAVRVLTGKAIEAALHEAMRDTSIWIFKGGTGTFTRQVTLPNCVQNALHHRRELRAYIEILDPSDLSLCEQYVRLYQALAESPADNEMSWDADGTRRELYATVLAACWYRKRYRPLVQVEIRLSQAISTLRWDLSSHSIIVTQRGPRFPALIIEEKENKIHYDSWKTELQTGFGQCRPVPLEQAEQLPLSEPPTTSEARDMFDAIGLSLPAEYDEQSVSEIIQNAFRRTDQNARGAGEQDG
jgi:hypothetical protein